MDPIYSRCRFLELSSILEPERPPKSDKFAILGEAIRVLNQLRVESQEFKETREKLLEEIKALKVGYIYAKFFDRIFFANLSLHGT